MHDIIQKGSWNKVAIKDRTKNKQGVPTFTAMERILTKTLNNR